MEHVNPDPIHLHGHGTVFREFFVEAQAGVRLRVLSWTPTLMAADAVPLIFVAGWVSAVQGWAELLRAVAARRPVYYIESREKVSALIERKRLAPADFSIARMAEDLIAACDALPIDPADAVIAASSLGATAVLEALKFGRMNVRGAFLIGPNSEFRAPRALLPITALPAATYHIVKYIVLWYVKTFRVDAKREPEQWARYNATLRGADPKRLKLSARAIFDYTVWRGLETIRVPVAVAYARTDKLHGSENVLRIVNTLPNARAIPCESNKAMHDARILADLDGFITGLRTFDRRSAV